MDEYICFLSSHRYAIDDMDPDTQEIIREIYQQSEKGHIDKSVWGCVRLARLTKDYLSLFSFLKELAAGDGQFKLLISNEALKLSKESFGFLWKRSIQEFCETHRLHDFNCEIDGDGKALDILNRTISELMVEVGHFEDELSYYDRRLRAGCVDPDYLMHVDSIRHRLLANKFIIERVRNKCLNYASRMEMQIKVQDRGAGFLEQVQSNVNNYFSARSSDVYQKLMKACELVGMDDSESDALLLTAVRRAIKAVADLFYPPADGSVVCFDGKKREMGNDKYMNRLREYCERLLSDHTTVNRMVNSEVEYFVAFVKRINDLSCKGVHRQVTSYEARQGLICLYMFLSVVVDKLQQAEC